MSTVDKEATIRQRVEERPSFELKKVREVRMRDLGYRFIAGALTSVAAGAVTLVFGARTGGILLAFPAILAASLTLIEEQENSAEAREDARGAVMGGFALGLFAAVAALAFGALSGALALLLAAVTWLVVAVVGYALAWLG
ncbi:MAG: DUF3147 family protein [Solirubrobacterales bacterium]|nr:DUF3147 family protein [Solirubrobacterales bacterium]